MSNIHRSSLAGGKKENTYIVAEPEFVGAIRVSDGGTCVPNLKNQHRELYELLLDQLDTIEQREEVKKYLEHHTHELIGFCTGFMLASRIFKG